MIGHGPVIEAWPKTVVTLSGERAVSLAVSARNQTGPPRAYAPKTVTNGKRMDIQGLRAIAVGVVLLYHANAPFMPGGFVGVDVFFVISGFLITGLLLKEANETGSISLTGFYARRAKRILPAATMVLVASALLTYSVLPRTRWDDTATQIFAAAFNIVNWILAGSAVDYLAGDDAASPVQHFWTLAVEEQFYIVWPLLIVAAIFFSRKGGRSQISGLPNGFNVQRRTALIRLAVLLLTVPSLAWSIYYTAVEPGSAYFVTTTRAWELGIGAMAAVFAVRLSNLPTVWAAVLSWGGLAAIVISSTLYTSDTPFPGFAALLPALGAMSIIIGGMAGRSSLAAGRLLSLRLFTWIGDISYSLYLWHWPLIVVATYVWGGLSFAQGLLVIGISIVPAYLSYKFVEDPILKSERIKDSNSLALQLGTIFICVAGIAAVSILLIPKPVSTAGFVPMKPLADTSSPSSTPAIGAELLATDKSVGSVVDTVRAFQPSALEAVTDNPVVYDRGCHQTAPGTEPKSCVFGNAGSEFTIAIVGDSHAAQWVPALSVVAEKNSWRMESFTKSACPLTTATLTQDGGPYETCTAWNKAVLAQLTGPEHPDFVLVSSSDYDSRDANFSSEDGLAGSWFALRSAGVPFAVIADTPRPGINVPECVSANPDELSKCAVDKATADQNGLPDQMLAAAALGAVPIVNLNSMICPESRCAPIVGEVLVYRDTNHITATYSETLAGALDDALKEFHLPGAAPMLGPSAAG